MLAQKCSTLRLHSSCQKPKLGLYVSEPDSKMSDSNLDSDVAKAASRWPLLVGSLLTDTLASIENGTRKPISHACRIYASHMHSCSSRMPSSAPHLPPHAGYEPYGPDSAPFHSLQQSVHHWTPRHAPDVQVFVPLFLRMPNHHQHSPSPAVHGQPSLHLSSLRWTRLCSSNEAVCCSPWHALSPHEPFHVKQGSDIRFRSGTHRQEWQLGEKL